MNLNTFNKWFRALLLVNTKQGEFGLEHPMGACCFRDLLRDTRVKAALKDAWERQKEDQQQVD